MYILLRKLHFTKERKGESVGKDESRCVVSGEGCDFDDIQISVAVVPRAGEVTRKSGILV